MKDYFNVKITEIKGIIAEERKNIGKLHPVTDKRFRGGEEVLIKYAVITDGCHNDTRCVRIGWEKCSNFNDSKRIPAWMWSQYGEHAICKEDAIIGWLFTNELNDALA